MYKNSLKLAAQVRASWIIVVDEATGHKLEQDVRDHADKDRYENSFFFFLCKKARCT